MKIAVLGTRGFPNIQGGKEFMDKPLSDEEKRRQISMVAERYDWQRIADRMLEAYWQVIGGGKELAKIKFFFAKEGKR